MLRTTDAWERYVTRQARWVDFEDDYKTMDLSFMESVMWAFKRLYDKGLVYEGYRVLPYCWECETPLSNFETRQDDAYRDRDDPAVTVAFRPRAAPSGGPDAAARARSGCSSWTTTPWTLPSNLALAVGPDLDYAVLDLDGRPRRARRGPRRVPTRSCSTAPSSSARCTGASSSGARYRPLFDYFADTPSAFVVLGEDFVATDEGTGIVHMAPGFGEDDQRACEAAGIAGRLPGRRPGALHRRGARLRRRRRSSRPTPASSSGCARQGRCSRVRGATPTATRTAGGPTRRSSTGP